MKLTTSARPEIPHLRRRLPPSLLGVPVRGLRRSVVGSLHLGHLRTGTHKMSFGKSSEFGRIFHRSQQNTQFQDGL